MSIIPLANEPSVPLVISVFLVLRAVSGKYQTSINVGWIDLEWQMGAWQVQLAKGAEIQLAKGAEIVSPIFRCTSWL